MAGRRHLRTRVYGIAVVYAVTLLAITLLLTLRAKQTHARYDALIGLEIETIARLNDFITAQSTFAQRGRIDVASGADLSALGARYRTTDQILRALPYDAPERAALIAGSEVLGREVRAFAATAATSDAATRAELWGRIDLRSTALRERARALVAEKRAAIEAERPVLINDAQNVFIFALGIVWMIGIGSLAFAQMAVRKVVQPIENLARAAEAVANNDFTVRAPVAGDHEVAELGVAFNRMADSLAKYDAQLTERATTDELTRLPNFRAFREKIEAEIERVNRYEHTFGVLVLDLDHFKRYNDTWGHLAGNEALKKVAEAIGRTVRNVDTPARYGGEEFAVIVPHVDAAGLAGLAERLRSAVEHIPPIEGRARLTVSIGGALCPIEGADAQSLFEVADARLYQAKEKGRNRAVTPLGATPAERSA